ncbi:hypothetical protein F5B22DRAFT_650741 [Xylaria bambusicola]|uniref:uncharacterized protein n=1 Tax=Xylaria bambusicola TaxID=326684 RepID=UPI0020080798|nr:uncharacterized protein F5B22DRAFT_650741 [Xylaria bambusicola]KAI0506350.1 hypothetical protein F5B22DRAFT_650741 [Xylaria bambusicola]
MAPSGEALERHLQEATRQLYSADPGAVTVNSVRQRVEEQDSLEKGFFVTPEWKARSKTLITEYVQNLMANDSPSSIRETKAEQDTKHAVKRSSSDEPSPSPVAKRQKRAGSTATSRNSKPKKESSSPALSALSDSDVESKTTKKEPAQKQESDSELSDLDLSEQDLKQDQKSKKPTATRKSKKEESESELSDLSSFEDKPKATKKRGRKSKKLGESEDDEKDTKTSTSRSKRKESIAKTKRTTKRTKVKSDNEDEMGVEDDVEMNKSNENKSAKDADSGDEAKPEESAIKPTVDDSDSSLSSVLDEPPPKKRKGRGAAKEAPKSKQSTSKEATGDEIEIKKLQGQLVKCGVRKIWGIELKKYGGDGKAKIRHLRNMLRDVGMDGRFSEAKAREIKERRELIGELEAVNEMNELWGLEGRGGRASRSKAVRKSLKEETDEDDDDDHDGDEKKSNETDEKDIEVKAASRKSKRMADLAFLGSDSESE